MAKDLDGKQQSGFNLRTTTAHIQGSVYVNNELAEDEQVPFQRKHCDTTEDNQSYGVTAASSTLLTKGILIKLPPIP